MNPDSVGGLFNLDGKNLFMAGASGPAILVTRTGKKMRRRTLNFPDAHAALDWCLQRQANFVLVSSGNINQLN